MTAFAINSGGVEDWDTKSGGSTNATLDVYTISVRSTLRIDCDTYHCANHSEAFGSLDTVAFSGLGGVLLLDGTNVRVIPYDTGSGNVPSIGTSITQGGITAELLGVWADWQSEPTAVGAAMPSSGYIKVKDKTGGSFSSGALTGIGASATGADVVGWIEVRCADTTQATLPRLGKIQATGDWFEIGTTSGTRGQVIPCPTTATTADVFPAIWVETGVASGVYEIYHSVGALADSSSTPTDATRGKIFWQTTSGIVIGSDGVNNVGHLPASGLRVRIPNIIVTCCTRTGGSGSGPRVAPNTTLTTRWGLNTTGAGEVDLSGVVWLPEFDVDSATVFDVVDSAIADYARLRFVGLASSLVNVCVAPTRTVVSTAVDIEKLSGVTITDCVLASAVTNSRVMNQQYSPGTLMTDTKLVRIGNRTVGTPNIYIYNGAAGSIYTRVTTVGGGFDCRASNVQFIDGVYTDRWSGTVDSANSTWIYYIRDASDIFIDGFTLPVADNACWRMALEVVGPTDDVTLRNVGSYGTPLDLGNATERFFKLSGSGDNIRVQRCYVQNTRSGFWQGANSYTNFTIENCSTDSGDDARQFSELIQRGTFHDINTALVTPIYGCHWNDGYTSATVGYVLCDMAEPTANTAAQSTITAGAPLYSTSHDTYFPTVGDQIVTEMPYFALGHESAANLAPTVSGANTGNLTLEFQYDLGSGYGGSWLTLNQTNWFAVGAIDPDVGIRIKVRCTCATANNGNILSRIQFPTVTSATAQENSLHPLDVATVSVEGLATSSRVKLTRNDTSAIIDTAVESSGSVEFETDYLGAVTVEARKTSGSPYYKPWTATGTLTATGLAFVAQQVLDE